MILIWVHPAFIKVDVEGFEPNVLAGARRLIAKACPLMLVEFNSWTLLLQHYDPLTFAGAIWSSFDVLQMFQGERPLPPSPDPTTFVCTNLTQHGCVTDLLLRPKAEVSNVHVMTDTPQAAQLHLLVPYPRTLVTSCVESSAKSHQIIAGMMTASVSRPARCGCGASGLRQVIPVRPSDPLDHPDVQQSAQLPGQSGRREHRRGPPADHLGGCQQY